MTESEDPTVEAERALQKEIESIRVDVSIQVEHAESLLKMFRMLLQRVDIIAKRQEDTMAENIRLRAVIVLKDTEIDAKDLEIEALRAKLAALEAK